MANISTRIFHGPKHLNNNFWILSDIGGDVVGVFYTTIQINKTME